MIPDELLRKVLAKKKLAAISGYLKRLHEAGDIEYRTSGVGKEYRKMHGVEETTRVLPLVTLIATFVDSYLQARPGQWVGSTELFDAMPVNLIQQFGGTTTKSNFSTFSTALKTASQQDAWTWERHVVDHVAEYRWSPRLGVESSPEPPRVAQAVLVDAPPEFMQAKPEPPDEPHFDPPPDYDNIPGFDEISKSIVQWVSAKGDFTPLAEFRAWFDVTHYDTVQYIGSFVDPNQELDYMREILGRMVDDGALISKRVSSVDMWRESYGSSFDKFKQELDIVPPAPPAIPEPDIYAMDLSVPDSGDLFPAVPEGFDQGAVHVATELPPSDDDLGDDFEDLTRPAPAFVPPKPRPRPKYNQDQQLRDTVQRLIDQGEELDWETLRDSFPDVDKTTFLRVRSESVSRSVSTMRSDFEQAPQRSRSRSPHDSEEDDILEDPIVPFLPHLEPESDMFREPTPDPQMYDMDPDPPDPPPAVEVATSRGYIPPIMVGLLFFWLATQAT
jgi:hypothetical protein